MRPGLPLAILLLGPLAGPLASQGKRPLLERILLAEDHRAGSPAELALLLKGLASPDTLVLRRSLRALGRLERWDQARRFFPLLAHPLPGVRAEAAQALAQAAQGFRGDSNAALAALRARVSLERDPDVRGMLALSLARLPLTPEEISPVREWLLSLAAGAEGAVLVDVARALETQARLTARRIPLAADYLARLRELAREAHDPRARRAALGALLAAQAGDSLTLTLALQSPDPELRRLAVSGARGPVSAGLADSAPMVRYEALRAGARNAGSAFCPELRAAAGDSVAAVSLLALDLLGAFCGGDPLAERLLEDQLQRAGRDWHPAAHALVSLARLAPSRGAAALPPAASASVWQRRMYAARAALLLRDTTALQRLARDSVANVREAALAALHDLVGHAADSLARAALAARDYQLVLTAAHALAGSPERSEASHALLQALDRITRERKETSRDPRAAILLRLRELGDRSLASRLLPYLHDFDPAIADSAAALVTAWTGRAVPAAPRRLAPPPASFSLAELERLRGKRLRFSLVSGGAFEVELLLDDAPLTVLRVARLVARGYYDGLSFHRVVSNFVIQGGSPGANEYAGADRFLRDELGPRSHERGSLGISTRGRDTGDAQLFINLVDNPRLDYDYTVWGRVVSGMDVVDRVLEGDVMRRVELVLARGN